MSSIDNPRFDEQQISQTGSMRRFDPWRIISTSAQGDVTKTSPKGNVESNFSSRAQERAQEVSLQNRDTSSTKPSDLPEIPPDTRNYINRVINALKNYETTRQQLPEINDREIELLNRYFDHYAPKEIKDRTEIATLKRAATTAHDFSNGWGKIRSSDIKGYEAYRKLEERRAQMSEEQQQQGDRERDPVSFAQQTYKDLSSLVGENAITQLTLFEQFSKEIKDIRAKLESIVTHNDEFREVRQDVERLETAIKNAERFFPEIDRRATEKMNIKQKESKEILCDEECDNEDKIKKISSIREQQKSTEEEKYNTIGIILASLRKDILMCKRKINMRRSIQD